MNAPAPEADNQYSNSSGRSRGRAAGRFGRWRRGSGLLAMIGLIGAGLLLAAEFRPLYIVHVTTYGAGTSSVSTGSHDSFALVPIALLAVGLALVGLRQRMVAADAALAGLGIIVLLITLLGDLPDTRARGITHGLALASTTAAAGLYLETLGAVLLVGAAWRRSAVRGPGRAQRPAGDRGRACGCDPDRGRAKPGCSRESRHPDKQSVSRPTGRFRGYI